jgi:hypothetical protein
VENSEDKLRVAVLALVLAGLPWVARRRGVFGPAADSVTARLVRTGGCTTLCALIWVVVQIDPIPRSHTGFIIRGSWGDGGNVGNRQPVDWITEAVVLALIIGCAVVVKVVRALCPQADEAVIQLSWAFLGVILLPVVMDQAIITLYAAGIYIMTARRLNVTPAALGFGAGAGVLGSGLVYAVTAAAGLPGHGLILPVAMLGPLAAGFEAARRAPGAGSPEEQRQARTWQGLAAGVVGGGAVALPATILTGEITVLFFVPLLGALFGALGGTVGAAHPRKPRLARSWSAGLFVLR